MLNKRYSDFLPSLQASEELMVQVEAVSKEMDSLKTYIETEVCMKPLIPKHIRLGSDLLRVGFKVVLYAVFFVYLNTGAAEFACRCG